MSEPIRRCMRRRMEGEGVAVKSKMQGVGKLPRDL